MPSIFVASTEFIAAAEHQARSLGFPAAGVFVPHPIQDRTDDEMRAHADARVGRDHRGPHPPTRLTPRSVRATVLGARAGPGAVRAVGTFRRP